MKMRFSIQSKNRSKKQQFTSPSFLTCQASQNARRFHSTLPNYRSTPLVSLKNLARKLGVAEILVKDESLRFGLNAFKGLGGSYAIARVIKERAGLVPDIIKYRDLVSEETRIKVGHITFATATAGNHGKGVAWASKLLGYKSIIYVPRGTAKSRIAAISNLGGKVVETALNYDDTVRLCVKNAEKKDWVVVQDTAWPGYTQIPSWIMQGYTTIVSELTEQISMKPGAFSVQKRKGKNRADRPTAQRPTHLFLQAGVGGMAAAVLSSYIDCFGKDYPIFVIVEPDRAACMLVSAEKGDGRPHLASENNGGDLDTIMAGLACGEPNPLAWDVLRNLADAFVACSDMMAIRGMQVLGKPKDSDPTIVSGESGAVGVGLLWALCQCPKHSGLKKQLRLDENSRILFINTEGDTDPVNYKKVLAQELPH